MEINNSGGIKMKKIPQRTCVLTKEKLDATYGAASYENIINDISYTTISNLHSSDIALCLNHKDT